MIYGFINEYFACKKNCPEGKKPLRRPRCRWEDNIKMHLQEVECGGMNWTGLA
jgi:hypothetical protein